MKKDELIQERKQSAKKHLLIDGDLDEENCLVSCVVMASGYSRRYGSNKLLAPWKNGTLLDATLSQIPYDMLAEVVVITRYPEVEELTKRYPVRCILHNEEYQSDTIRIGIESLTKEHAAVMFLTCDQPLRTKQSISSMILESVNNKDQFIQLSYGDKKGNPIIFPREYELELKALKKKETGKVIVQKNLDKLLFVSALHPYELIDIDTKERYVELKQMLDL